MTLQKVEDSESNKTILEDGRRWLQQSQLSTLKSHVEEFPSLSLPPSSDKESISSPASQWNTARGVGVDGAGQGPRRRQKVQRPGHGRILRGVEPSLQMSPG